MNTLVNFFTNIWNDFYADFYASFIKEDRYMLLLDGIGVTIKVSLLAVVLGIIIGMIIALFNLSNSKLKSDRKCLYRCYKRNSFCYPAYDYLFRCVRISSC